VANIEIIPATQKDILTLRRNLREGDRTEVLNFGPCLRRILWDSFNYTPDPKSIFVHGELAAVFGCGGTVLGNIGNPWLLTTPISEKNPLLFVRTYKQQVMKMLENYDILENMVDAGYPKAIKLLEMVGFFVYPPQAYGSMGKMFRKFQMRVSDA
jgi:hypothetical protein